MMKFAKRWWRVILLMGMIFVVSTDLGSEGSTARIFSPVFALLGRGLNPDNLATIHAGIRKTAHVVEYAVLGFLLARALGVGSIGPRFLASWRMGSLGLVVAAAFAASDEFHQSFVPSRSASLHDVLLDVGGAVVGLIVAYVMVGKAAPLSLRSAAA